MSEKNVKTEKVKKDLKNGSGLGQLTVTLCAISAICALLLGLTNMVTAPIIVQNQEKKKTEAITANVMPGYTGVLSQVNYVGSDATILSVLKGDDNSFVVEVAPKGSFSGNLTLMVGIDPNRAITGVYAVSSGETAGKGSLALEADYLQAQYTGKSGPLSLGGEVEAVSGATITSVAVCNAVNSAFEAINNTADGPYDPNLTPSVPDEPNVSENIRSMAQEGSGYVAVVDCGGDSFSKTLVLRVTLDANKAVSGIEVVESGETPELGGKVLEAENLQKYVGQSGTAEVDGISGASFTSNAVNTGVNAVLKAAGYPDEWPQGSADVSQPAQPETGDNDGGIAVEQDGDGYVVTVDCGPDSFSKTLKIQVSLDADKKITGVTVLETGETDGVGSKFLEAENLQKYVGQSGTAEVDGIAGATYTSNAVNAGVNAALKAVE